MQLQSGWTGAHRYSRSSLVARRQKVRTAAAVAAALRVAPKGRASSSCCVIGGCANRYPCAFIKVKHHGSCMRVCRAQPCVSLAAGPTPCTHISLRKLQRILHRDMTIAAVLLSCPDAGPAAPVLLADVANCASHPSDASPIAFQPISATGYCCCCWGGTTSCQAKWWHWRCDTLRRRLPSTPVTGWQPPDWRHRQRTAAGRLALPCH
jgi:hypothetical protein